MRKALSFLGCLLLSIGSVAAEPSKWLSQDQYWFVEKDKDASTSTTGDGEQIVRTLTAGDTIAYCTLETTQGQVDSILVRGEDGNPIWVEETGAFETVEKLVFNKEEKCKGIPDGSGYFVRMSAKFTPRATPTVTASGDFPYRTLLYVKENHLAFLEREEGKCAAVEVVTDTEVTADTFLDITVQILQNKMFRVYVGQSEVTVNGAKRPYRSLQTGDNGHFAADKLHSFAFTGSVEFNNIEFTTVNPFTKTVTSIPFKFEYDRNALSNVGGVMATLDLTANKTYTVSFTRNTDQYEFLAPTLTGNSATLGGVTDDSITFTVADNLTDDNPLVLTLPSKAYFFALGEEKYGSFVDIFEAVQAKDDKTVSITCDINLDGEVSPGPQAFIKDGQEVVLDLKGHTIKGIKYRSENEDAAILNRGKLKIIDTSAEKTGTIEANGFAISTGDKLALENDANETIIKAGIFNGIVTNVAGRIQIDGGKFFNVFNQSDTKDDPFYLRNQSGISISAKFNAAVIADNYWQAPPVTDGKVLVEFRPDHGAAEPATMELDSVDDVTSNVLDSIKVTAPGYDTKTIEWTKEALDDTIWHGAMTALVYTVTYELGTKGRFESEVETSFSIESPILSLPVPADERGLWKLDYWYMKDDISRKRVTELGVDEDTFRDITLVAAWKPVEKVWTNATSDASLSEVNGYFKDVPAQFSLLIPASQGFESGETISLKSITLSTVNASPNNLARMAPYLCLMLDSETPVFAEAKIDTDGGTSDKKFEYFLTSYGYRPKVVYTFANPPTISINRSYTVGLVNSEAVDAYCETLLRLVKRPGEAELQLLKLSGSVPTSEYQSYVPMYEIKGEAK